MDLGAGDSVTIYDGDKPTDTLLARYTGTGSDGPQFVMTTGDAAYVYMDTSSFEAGRGFKFSYKMGTHSSSSISYLIPTFMWGRCTMTYASIKHGRTMPPVTVFDIIPHSVQPSFFLMPS